MKKKHDSVDLMNLYTNCSHDKWNSFLTDCFNRHDLGSLNKTLYGVQLGMDDLAKKKMNSQKIIQWYLRLCRSIEKTIKKIIRQKIPNPLDNPANKAEFINHLGDKRNRDSEIEKYIRKNMF